MQFTPFLPAARTAADAARAAYLESNYPGHDATPRGFVAWREAACDVWIDTYERELIARGVPASQARALAAATPPRASHRAGRRAIPLPAAS